MSEPAREPDLPLGADLERAVQAWLAHLRHERGHADKTLEAYARDVRQFLSYLAASLGYAPCLADLVRLDLKTFRGFLASRRRSGAVSRSLARTLSALRQLFRWLEAQELVENRAILQLAMPKVPHSVPKPLTVGKAAVVVDPGPAAELDWVLARDAAVLLLLYGSGLRIAEALSLKAKEVPTADRDVLRIRGKGDKERLVPVLPVVRSAVARYVELCPYPLDPDEALFRGARRPRHTPCAIPWPPTSCRPGAICGRSRNC
jgi:integrase/recombinase XerC